MLKGCAKYLAAVAGIALCGCASVAPGVTATTLYRAPAMGCGIGDVIRLEDEDAVYTFRVEKFGATPLGTFLKPGSKLVLVGTGVR